MERLFSSRFRTKIGTLRVVSSEKGLCYVGLPHASGRGFEGWRLRFAPESEVATAKTEPANECVLEQLDEYLQGDRRRFDLALDLRGTPFQLDVYREVEAIGYGEKKSYAQIASAIGRPRAVRAVGAANGANPIPLVIPCHRVIASSGSLQGYAGGLDLKARLLALESAQPRQGRLF